MEDVLGLRHVLLQYPLRWLRTFLRLGEHQSRRSIGPRTPEYGTSLISALCCFDDIALCETSTTKRAAMEIYDNDLVTKFTLWCEDANRDFCYADSQHGGEMLTSLQMEWRRRYPSRYVPTPVRPRDRN